MPTCSLHGPHAGSRCHRCTVEEQLRVQARKVEEVERDAARRHREAEVAADYRATEQARGQVNLVRHANKIRADSLTDRAKELFEAELYSEAVDTCRDALKEDRGWIGAYAIMGASLYELGKCDEAAESMLKAIRLLGHGEWNTPDIFNIVFSWIDDGDYPHEVMQELRSKVAENVEIADEDLVQYIAERGWGREVLKACPHVTLTYNGACGILKTLLAKKQARAAEAVLACTLALKESIPLLHSYESWLNLTLWAAEVELQAGRSRVLTMIMGQAETCRPEDGLGLLHFLASNNDLAALDIVRRNALLSKLAPFAAKWLTAREAAVVEHARNSVPPPPVILAWLPSVQTAQTTTRNRTAAVAASAYRKDVGPLLERSGISQFLESNSAESSWQVRTQEIGRAEKAWTGELLFAYASRAAKKRDFAKALPAFQEAADQFVEAEDYIAASSCLREMGWSTCPDQNPQGEWGKANEFFLKAIASAKVSDTDHVNIAAGLYGQGWCAEPVNNPQGDWSVSITLYKRAADAARRAKSASWEGDALHELGFCYASVSDWEKASEWYQRAAELRSAERLDLPLANTYYRLAVCLSKGEPSETTVAARELLQKTRLLYYERGDAVGVAKVDSWLEGRKEVPAP